VAREAIAAGAEIINDVTALLGDAGMLETAVATGAGVCIMHMQGKPRTMQENPVYRDVVREVHGFLAQRRNALIAAGVDPGRICLDPGIGFGKNLEHNLTLLSDSWRLHALGCPILVGHSRKRFIRHRLASESVDPLAGTIGVALSMARQGVQVIRVHDVAAVEQALTLFEATGGLA
jgi:dihydropteroate synthase